MISLSRDVLRDMLKDAEKRYPEECCGIIFGRINDSKTAECVDAVNNAFDKAEQYHRFEITPETMLKAELAARKKGLDIIGFYHSHPDCEAFPSEFDRTHAFPVYSYIIISVVKGEAFRTRSFVLSAEEKHFSEEEIIFKE